MVHTLIRLVSMTCINAEPITINDTDYMKAVDLV